MAADNWAFCPRCKNRARKAREEGITAAQALYGTVSRDEYEKALASVPDGDPGPGRTFREDYWFFNDNEGSVQVHYKGHCRECGLHLEFEDVRAIPGVNE